MSAAGPDAAAAQASGAAIALPRGTLIGRYVLLGRIGGGAMGEVYAAYDPELDRKLAIKLLKRPGRSGLEASRGRLQREAQAMARLRHPNVLAVHDVGLHDDQVFVVMELVEGQTLKAWLQERPRTWRDVRDVLVAAGRGLAAAHDAGLVHRDFKPDNVLIGRDGRVCVGDFGLARAATDEEPVHRSGGLEETAVTPHSDALAVALTQTGTFLGTPAYMAPEQLTGRATDGRADQFSFCVALHEALYGVRPFGGNTIGEITFEVLQGRLVDPPRGRVVPLWLRAAILRGLSARTEARFSSMAELLRALERNPARRRNVVALGAVLVAAGVGLVVGFGRPKGPMPLPTAPQNLDLEAGELGKVPSGWFAPTASVAYGYRVESVEAGARSGRRCAVVRRVADGPAEAGAFGNVMQTIRADAYRGKRVRLRAAVRVEGGPAALWLRVDRKGGAMGFFDNMAERPIRAAEWQPYDIVGQIAPDAETLNFGLMLLQGGQVWLDDVRLEGVGEDVAQTGAGSRQPALVAANLDFEDGPVGARPTGWQLVCLTATDCDATTTAEGPWRGARAVTLRRSLGQDDALSEVQLGQEISAAPFRGVRVRLSAALRARGGASARLWLQVNRSASGFSFYDDLSYAPVRGAEWTTARIEVLVPSDARSLSFGAILEGGGQAFFDGFALENVPSR